MDALQADHGRMILSPERGTFLRPEGAKSFSNSPECHFCGVAATVPPAARPHKLHIPRFRASAKARPFRCSSFPKHKRFAGLCFGFLRASVFAPVEYLTYGSRDRRRVFRLPRRAIQYASASRFCNLKYALHKPNPWGNSKKGASALFLVVLRGFQRGKSKQTQSISTTTPVCLIRSCIAFWQFERYFYTNQTPGNDPRRGSQPPSWSF